MAGLEMYYGTSFLYSFQALLVELTASIYNGNPVALFYYFIERTPRALQFIPLYSLRRAKPSGATLERGTMTLTFLNLSACLERLSSSYVCSARTSV